MLIQNFLDTKKEIFLQQRIDSKLKGKKNERDSDAQLKVREENLVEAENKYNLDIWIENIIHKIKPNVTTHPAKFTNAKIDTDSNQIFLGEYQQDGYLKTGNVQLKNKVDVSGSSATNAMIYELYELLDTNIIENEKVIHRIENNDEGFVKFIKSFNTDYELIKEKCLKVYYGESSDQQTHSSIRQVYFPIENGTYHLLSIKTASLLMYEIKSRINTFDIWIDGDHVRSFKKNNKYLENGFSEILGITEISFSHKDFIKMGNYSYLNVKNKGIAYLLASTPPTLEKRSIRLPKTDFFAQCLRRKNFQDSFIQLHRLMKPAHKNDDVRQGIKNIIHFIIDRILLEAFKIREHYDSDWSSQDYYEYLPKLQRIWLDNAYQNDRDVEWREELSIEVARWILHCYEKTIHDAFILGDGELSEVKKMVTEAINKDKEYF